MILLLGSVISLLYFRRLFAARVERLKNFSRRLPEGDFHLRYQSEGQRDELSRPGRVL